MSPEHFNSGLINPAGNGSRNTGFDEISVTHPYVVAGQTALQASRFEASAEPRAIISRQILYNADFNPCVASNPTFPANEYFMPEVTQNADGLLGSPLLTTGSGPTFPLMALCLTPSISVYKAQQERFQHFRMRFITQVVTPYYSPELTTAQNGVTYIINQATANGTLAGQQKVIYGQPINGVFGGSQNTTTAGNFGFNYSASSMAGSNVSRVTGQMYTGSACNYAPIEQYTNVSFPLSVTGIELNEQLGVKMVCMDSTQIILQYQVNFASQCLSAYLQPSLFMTQNATQNTMGPSTAQVQQFLNCCLLQDTSFVLTDLVVKMIYYTYPEESYAMVRELCYQPQAYFSCRMQIDPIPGPGQMFQRVSCGGASIISGCLIFIVPNNNTQNYLTAEQATDTCVNYLGVNPPCIGDLRCNPAWDSYYVNCTDIYAQVDNQRYQTNAIPLSNPQYVNYLNTVAGIQAGLGRYFNVPLDHYLKNRFCYWLSINPFQDRSKMITDQQIILNFSIDFTARVESSTMYNETNKSPNNQFSVLTYLITCQSLVACDYIKI